MTEASFTGPQLFDTMSDLSPGELETELEGIIGRACTAREAICFQQLVSDSKGFAEQRRRITLAALRDPWLRETPQAQPVFTERELLLAKCSLKPASAYPVSSGKVPITKEEVRNKLAMKISAILRECKFPAAELFMGSRAPERLVGRFGAGKRSSTLAQKIRAYENMKRWMTVCYSKCFPTRIIEAVDYVLDRGSEPCGPSIPGMIISTICFFENLGGVIDTAMVGTSKTLKAIADDLKLELASSKPVAKRKAHQMLLAFVAAWEMLVCNPGIQVVRRVQAWTKLIKVWASLRTADLAGIPARSLSFVGGVLSGKIAISKTTGVGKSVQELWFWVSAEAWLIEKEWLEIGWNLFRQFVTDRSFFLPLPTKDEEAFSTREPDYAQWNTTDRRLLADTAVLEMAGDEDWDGTLIPVESDKRLLVTGAQSFWVGHGDRATLNSWAAALDISRTRRDPCGRWGPTGSDEYTRVSRDLVLGVQSEVAKRARTADGKDVFFELGLLREFSVFCVERGIPIDEVETMCANFNSVRAIIGRHSDFGTTESPHEFEEDIEDPPDVQEPTGGWPILSLGARVVSVTGGGANMTLHKVGSCWRRPGIHYARFDVLDEGEIGTYSSLCRDCYPKQIDVDLVEASSGDESNSSTDSDSSS